jgi:hypothetical protein
MGIGNLAKGLIFRLGCGIDFEAEGVLGNVMLGLEKEDLMWFLRGGVGHEGGDVKSCDLRPGCCDRN